MFGGIAAAGIDRLVYATFDGHVVSFDVESGAVTGQFTVAPCGPERVHLSSCAAAPGGTLLFGDTMNRRVRRFRDDGRQVELLGDRPNPGIPYQDDAGTLAEPCAILPLDGQVLVTSGGLGARHGVQLFAQDGGYVRSLTAPPDGWKHAQGLALIDDAIWVAETGAGAIRRFARDGTPLDPVDLHPDLDRPFRLAPDGYGRALLLLAPDEEEPRPRGVAHLESDGRFEGWAVPAGEEPGRVFFPFDVAVLRDGRFAVADLPLGGPPEVRLQLFSPDGQLLTVLLEDSEDLREAQRKWFAGILQRDDDSAWTCYEQARVHHHYSGGTADHLAEARRLYEEAARREPGFFLAHLGLATLLRFVLDDPAAAEVSFAQALEADGVEGEMKARIAGCRRALGDFDGAIQILQEAIDSAEPPEDYHGCVEDLGSYYLERAGESAET